MKRGFKLEGLNQEFVISKFSEIDLKDKEFIYFDKLKDGTWRVCWTKNTITDFKKLQGIKILRNDCSHINILLDQNLCLDCGTSI